MNNQKNLLFSPYNINYGKLFFKKYYRKKLLSAIVPIGLTANERRKSNFGYTNLSSFIILALLRVG